MDSSPRNALSGSVARYTPCALLTHGGCSSSNQQDASQQREQRVQANRSRSVVAECDGEVVRIAEIVRVVIEHSRRAGWRVSQRHNRVTNLQQHSTAQRPQSAEASDFDRTQVCEMLTKTVRLSMTPCVSSVNCTDCVGGNPMLRWPLEYRACC